jgi:hypothetical protein
VAVSRFTVKFDSTDRLENPETLNRPSLGIPDIAVAADVMETLNQEYGIGAPSDRTLRPHSAKTESVKVTLNGVGLRNRVSGTEWDCVRSEGNVASVGRQGAAVGTPGASGSVVGSTGGKKTMADGVTVR